MIGRQIRTEWADCPEKRIISIEEVDHYFDPKDREKDGNTWLGLVTQPVQNDALAKELTTFVKDVICSGDENHYDFLMKCMAFPVQQLGQRIYSGIILQSAEGYGKDTFSRLMLSPWGRYGRMLNQNDMEDRFNPHLEGLNQIVYQEIGASRETDHHKIKNLLKYWVDTDEIRMNPKQVNGRMIKNRITYWFMTNEILPFLLGNQGRRWCVLRLTIQKTKEYYTKINDIIKSEAGRNAWHWVLDTYDLAGFTGREEPPTTEAKTQMVELSEDFPIRFWKDFTGGFIPNLPNKIPVLREDLSSAYFKWAKDRGIRNPGIHDTFIALIRQQPRVNDLRCTYRIMGKETLVDEKGNKSERDVVLEEGIGRFILPPDCEEITGAKAERAECMGEFVLKYRKKLKK